MGALKDALLRGEASYYLLFSVLEVVGNDRKPDRRDAVLRERVSVKHWDWFQMPEKNTFVGLALTFEIVRVNLSVRSVSLLFVDSCHASVLDRSSRANSPSGDKRGVVQWLTSSAGIDTSVRHPR